MRDFTKRAFDVTLALLGLVLTAPLLAALAAAIRCTSPGSALYRQQRVGRDGRLFWLLKFRSMRPVSGGLAITAAGDARITPIGRWLRQWKLDELPQLFNVLRGDMSLVGPRPEVPHYVALYAPHEREVLAARPGITGASQICFRDEERLLAARDDPEAYYVATLMPAKLAIDREYVRRYSLLYDLQLLAETVLAVCRPRAVAQDRANRVNSVSLNVGRGD